MIRAGEELYSSLRQRFQGDLLRPATTSMKQRAASGMACSTASRA